MSAGFRKACLAPRETERLASGEVEGSKLPPPAYSGIDSASGARGN
jgi:hypothetical protein